MKMKKVLHLFALAAVLAGSGVAARAQEVKPLPNFQLLLDVGGGYAHNREMDDMTKWLGKNLADNLNTVIGSSDFETENKSGSINYGVSVEPRMFFGNLGVGVAVGYYNLKSESKVSSDVWSDEATYSLELSVVPIIASVYYRFQASRSGFILLGAGAGYYLSTLKAKQEDKVSIGSDFNYDEKFTKNAIGYHVKLEYDYLIGSYFTLFAGVLGRYVSFDEYEKDGDYIRNKDGDKLKAGLSGVNLYLGAGFNL